MTQIQSVPVQLVGRFIWGIAAGVNTVLVPKFITETAPKELNGTFGAISQIMVTLGILLATLLCMPIPYF